MPLDVMFYEAFEEEAEAIRKHVPEGMKAGFTWKTIQESGDTEPPARVVSTRTQSEIPLDWAGGVTGILTRSTGYDHINSFRLACGREVAAGYLPRYCSRAVAEHAMMLWVSLLRKLPRQLASFGRFRRDGLTGGECLGRTVMVVGVGNVGSEVVKIAEGLGMTALGVDIVERHDFVKYVSFDEGLPRADVIVCAMNLTRANAGYFDYERLKDAKPGPLSGSGAVFVNIARGEHAPSADLLRLLEEGRLAGVGLDVYEEESELAVGLREGKLSIEGDVAASPSVAATLELVRRDDVIATPHNAFNTAEAVERKAQLSVEAVAEFLRTGAFPSPVPPPE